MSRPRPKFCVGEQVAVTSIRGFNIAQTEITEVFWAQNLMTCLGLYTGWRYRVAAMPPGRFSAAEERVHKLPPPNRIQWHDCAWQPKNLEEETIT